MRHSHSHSITDNPGQLLGVTTLAAAAGAVTALLFTPRSGRQMRAGLRRRAAHMREDMMLHPQDTEVSNDVQKTMQDAKARLGETASKVTNDTKSTAKKVTEDAKDTSREAKDAADRAKRS